MQRLQSYFGFEKKKSFKSYIIYLCPFYICRNEPCQSLSEKNCINIISSLQAKGLHREYVYSAVVYQKYLTRLRELIIFEPWRENYHFSQPS